MKSLNRILLLNSLSSGATGLLMIALSSTIAGWFGVSSGTAFIAVGIFLVLFATLVFTEARAERHNISRIRLIITLDVLWVAASVIILVLQPFDFMILGDALTGGVALWVAAMAYLQFNGLRQVQS